MPRSPYLKVRENFVHISLVSSTGKYVEEDYGDVSSGAEHECYCHVCNKKLTVDQFKKGKLVDSQLEELEYILMHKTCRKDDEDGK
ncbi:hypothetical protein CN918_29570 [Priestia megaterium]|nr:hypothetical protein CN918_29570 [Priestia megaterium]